MPLHRLLHIALCLLLLLAAFGACTEEEVVTVAPTRTLTVDLGITLTRATEGTSIGDGSQPLISRRYGEGDAAGMRSVRRLAYGFALFLAAAGCLVMYFTRDSLGLLFGTSDGVNAEVAGIMPIFLISVPFVAVTRVTTASFYACEKSLYSYVLTFIEPALMLVFMLALPPFFGGQLMIWWSTVIARMLSAMLSLALKARVDRQGVPARQR